MFSAAVAGCTLQESGGVLPRVELVYPNTPRTKTSVNYQNPGSQAVRRTAAAAAGPDETKRNIHTNKNKNENRRRRNCCDCNSHQHQIVSNPVPLCIVSRVYLHRHCPILLGKTLFLLYCDGEKSESLVVGGISHETKIIDPLYLSGELSGIASGESFDATPSPQTCTE